jgi:hypothetical protein
LKSSKIVCPVESSLTTKSAIRSGVEIFKKQSILEFGRVWIAFIKKCPSSSGINFKFVGIIVQKSWLSLSSLVTLNIWVVKSENMLLSFIINVLNACKGCFLAFMPTVCSYPKVAISKHFTVNQVRTLIEAQSLI